MACWRGQPVNGDTFCQANNHTGYGCGWNATGPELIYRFTLAPGRNYTVIAELGNMMVDLDVYLLAAGGCNAGQCLSAGSYGDYKVVANNVPPGTYYIAVDGYQGHAGSYTLKLTCTTYSLYLPIVIKNQ
ncbi:MAG: PPC domain-containing protein [Chloroflexi bacterium]|nr:PPC domain-containing protein [Chloroflexota bacterium]MBU1751169.1 PPC domain-containing protein [Chloroflexota bacterium]MBU1880109.1 PPC domain-containing protein [Chloroflexota bacterium]